MKSIPILIAEDNPCTRNELVKALEGQQGIQVVAAVGNGVDALRHIRECSPQVVVCDVVMPKLDGFGVLKVLSGMDVQRKPKMIMLTALNRDDFITRAIAMGASYYMVKPVEMDSLVQQIVTLSSEATVLTQPQPPPDNLPIEQEAARMLLNLGIPAHLNGYRFLLSAIVLAVKDPTRLRRITSSLYPSIAEPFDTTPSCVERSIRHAISIAWSRGGSESFSQIMNCRSLSPEDKPTNCELIALLAEQI